jgi:hypothetical protein
MGVNTIAVAAMAALAMVAIHRAKRAPTGFDITAFSIVNAAGILIGHDASEMRSCLLAKPEFRPAGAAAPV